MKNKKGEGKLHCCIYVLLKSISHELRKSQWRDLRVREVRNMKKKKLQGVVQSKTRTQENKREVGLHFN